MAIVITQPGRQKNLAMALSGSTANSPVVVQNAVG